MALETDVMAAIRLEASRRGHFLWRNNRGVLLDNRGKPVRFGLANDSKAVGERYASADLIGWTRDGRFLSVEVKRSRRDPISPAQVAWRDLVRASGGIAVIAYGPEDLPS